MICHICLKDSGAVEFHDSCLRKMFGTASVVTELSFDRREFFQEKALQFTEGMSVSGFQHKLSVKIVGNALEVTDIGGEYILKPSPERYQELAENEHLGLRISKLLGIDTASSALVKFKGGELCLLVKRFDRDKGELIHQEDMLQAMNITEGKYSQSYEEVGLFLSEHTSLAVVKDFFQRIFLNFMIGNGDCHLKNISIREHRGVMQLTPSYDVLNTSIYNTKENDFAIDFLKDDVLTPQRAHFGNYSKYDFDELGKKLGLNSGTLKSVYKSFFENEKAILSLIKRSPLSKELIEKFIRTLEVRKRFFLQN